MTKHQACQRTYCASCVLPPGTQGLFSHNPNPSDFAYPPPGFGNINCKDRETPLPSQKLKALIPFTSLMT